MKWNAEKYVDGYTLEVDDEADIDKLWGIASGPSWFDCKAFLNQFSAILFPEMEDFDSLLQDMAKGEYGEIEGTFVRLRSGLHNTWR